jgi:hypothetical protein
MSGADLPDPILAAVAPLDPIRIEAGCAAPEPSLSASDRDVIGERLRAMYRQLEGQPVPPHLLALIRRLDGGETSG